MSIYRVDEHRITHTCPADPTPHVIDIRRRIVHVTPGRPCLTPVTITSGAVTATVPCGRYLPARRQCGHCRTIITTGRITTEHRGHNPACTGPDTGGAVA